MGNLNLLGISDLGPYHTARPGVVRFCKMCDASKPSVQSNCSAGSTMTKVYVQQIQKDQKDQKGSKRQFHDCFNLFVFLQFC